jgi:hypothetical protein
MPYVGTVDERFNSYNVEMAEVIGGTFWKPYKDQGNAGWTIVDPNRTLAGQFCCAAQRSRATTSVGT